MLFRHHLTFLFPHDVKRIVTFFRDVIRNTLITSLDVVKIDSLKTSGLVKLLNFMIAFAITYDNTSQGTYVEGIKEEVVLSPGHALSFIAAGEGKFRRAHL